MELTLQQHLAKARKARDPKKVAEASRRNGELGGRPKGKKNKKRNS